MVHQTIDIISIGLGTIIGLVSIALLLTIFCGDNNANK
jgi:hypothetical protein